MTSSKNFLGTHNGVRMKIISPNHGTCRMCGKKDCDLWMLYIVDYMGLTCAECIDMAQKCQVRRFSTAVEETETVE